MGVVADDAMEEPPDSRFDRDGGLVGLILFVLDKL
jgi:hypothetical protein